MGFNVGESVTPIVPVIIGDDERTFKTWQDTVEQRRVFVTSVISPAEPQGMQLLRPAIMASPTDAQIDQVLDVFKKLERRRDYIRILQAPADGVFFSDVVANGKADPFSANPQIEDFHIAKKLKKTSGVRIHRLSIVKMALSKKASPRSLPVIFKFTHFASHEKIFWWNVLQRKAFIDITMTLMVKLVKIKRITGGTK